MQRTGLNRHRRGYVTKERAQRRVPFLVLGPIGLARSQFLNFILSSSLSSSLFPSHNRYHQVLNPITRECQKHSTSTGTIALSRAVVPINTSSSGISRNLGKTSPTHATRCQTTPINLVHNYSSNCKTQLKMVLGLSCTGACLVAKRSQ